jgi:ubiquinol-cytochrome c reductase cytochrome c subunit
VFERNRNLFRRKRIARRAGFPAFFILSLVAFSTIGSTAQIPSGSPHAENSDSGRVENGKRIYLKDGCYECHGRDAQGSRLSGPKVGPQPIPLSAFVAYVRAPGGQMPPYTSKVISDAELSDISTFLKSLPEPPAVKNIPMLN